MPVAPELFPSSDPTVTLINQLADVSRRVSLLETTSGRVQAGAITGSGNVGGVNMIAVNAITAAEIRAGSITAATLSAGAIDGITITGSTLQTSSNVTNARVILDTSGLKGYPSGDGTQAPLVTVSAVTGLISAKGVILNDPGSSAPWQTGGWFIGGGNVLSDSSFEERPTANDVEYDYIYVQGGNTFVIAPKWVVIGLTPIVSNTQKYHGAKSVRVVSANMAPQVTDSFTGTSNSAITAHTSDTAHTWAQHASETPLGTAVISNANRARAGTADASKYTSLYSSYVPPSADYEVQADLYAADATGDAALWARLSTTALTGYLFQYWGGAYKLYSCVSGVYTIIGSYTSALTVGSTYAAKLKVKGTLIQGFVGGVPVISVTDSTVSAAGRGGVRFSGAGTDTTSLHLDNFKLNVGVAGTGVIGQAVPLPAGMDLSLRWTISAYVKSGTASPSAQVYINWYNAASALISQSAGPATTTTTTWTRILLTATPPAGTASCQVGVKLPSNVAYDGDWYLDAVQFEQGDAPTAFATRADEILANSITAQHINVANLAAISADIGTVTAGLLTGTTIRTAATGARVQMTGGTTNAFEVVDNSTGAGTIQLAIDGATGMRFNQGAGALSSIEWADGVTGTILGKLNTYLDVNNSSSGNWTATGAGNSSSLQIVANAARLYSGVNVATWDKSATILNADGDSSFAMKRGVLGGTLAGNWVTLNSQTFTVTQPGNYLIYISGTAFRTTAGSGTVLTYIDGTSLGSADSLYLYFNQPYVHSCMSPVAFVYGFTAGSHTIAFQDFNASSDNTDRITWLATPTN